ncbi:MAG: hypothetical protein ACRDP4_14030, partial [Nocardioidaceae bacterium]
TRTDAISPISGGTAAASYAAFGAVFVALAVTDWVLLSKLSRRGPDGTHLGADQVPEHDEPVPAVF